MDNTIDDAKFDEILKQNNVTPIVEGADPWADFGPVTPEPSFMDTVKSRASAVVEDPVEAIKGAGKEFSKGLMESYSAMNPVTSAAVDYFAPKVRQTFEDILEPSNEAQKGGANITQGAEMFAGGGPAIKTAKEIPSLVKGTGEYLAERGATKEANFIKDLITPELTQTKGINAIKTGKVTEGGLLKDRDITGAIPFFEDTTKAVSEVPGISKNKTLLENNNAIHDHIGTVADDLVSQLKTLGKEMKIANLEQVPEKFSQYMESVKATLKENPTLVGDAEKTATKILDKFESLVKEEGSTPDAILSARKKLDAWMSAQKGDNIFDPKTEGAVSVALRAIRQGGNDFISSLAKDVDGNEIVKVKDMLAKQTNLYNAIDSIAPKAFKEGSSGFKRWVKAHPKTVGLMGAGASAIGGGAVVGSILK